MTQEKDPEAAAAVDIKIRLTPDLPDGAVVPVITPSGAHFLCREGDMKPETARAFENALAYMIQCGLLVRPPQE